jgi:hypothetical protein
VERKLVVANSKVLVEEIGVLLLFFFFLENKREGFQPIKWD